MSLVSINQAAAKAFIEAAFITQGLPDADAATVAGLMSEAEAQGSDGHGIIRLPQYINRIQAGGINVRPNIQTVNERPAMALVDGDNGMGHLVVSQAVKIAIVKARQAGVAWVGTQNSNHAGPASLYARQALEHGMIALYFAVGNANHMPPWGGVDMLLSTNPFAAAIPAANAPPVVLDMATTVAAYGKVKAKAKRGEQMPVGWMIDKQGKPLTDPTKASEGFLLPIGDHKGYGLALVIGLLAGTLNGAAMGRDVVDFNVDHATPTNTGQAILMIDIAAFQDPDVFGQAVAQVVRDIQQSDRLPGVDRIWLPGEQSHEKRQRSVEVGFSIPSALFVELNALAAGIGIAPLQGQAA